MPISPAVLQRRHAELGRIRLGAKRGGNGAPMKLEQFRFTSPSQGYINDLATIYGGTPQPWDNGGKAEFEVYTDAKSIPVIAVKGGMSQWLETWSGGGCIHRCDGEVNVLNNQACDPNDRAHQNAKPTTRLSVMLPELDAIGVWRMESHGWNAAAEIPAVAELAQYVGDLVPAELHLVERRAIKDGKTSRFVVPVLDLRIGQARLQEIVAAKSGAELAAPAAAAALSGGGAAAIAAPVPNYRGAADNAVNVDTVRELWQQASHAGHLDDDLRAYLSGRVAALKEAAAPAAAAPAPEPVAAVGVPDADGVVDAEVVDDHAEPDTVAPVLDPNMVWQQILAATGARGMTLPDTEDAVLEFLSISSAEASGEELQLFLDDFMGRAA